uniref:V-set and immunoglobulin domain containing 8 n=1 Tax=Cyanoderma ruficeps TaxID=181631 RepID=A0A8C3QK67_9PASS
PRVTGAVRALLVAVRINSKGREVLYLAKGDSVKLGCPYVLEPEDNGPQGVGIEWIQIQPERPGPENVFLSYQDHHVNYGSGSGLQDRVAFVQTDPGQRDASIRLADLQESDTGTYQCRVKKNTVAVHEVIVTVQGEGAAPGVAPVWPRCHLSPPCPTPQRGRCIVQCHLFHSQCDSVPVSPPGRAPGDLLIRSLTVAHAGTYQCRVTNRVGYSVCGRQAGIIVGSILGSLLLLSLLGLLIWPACSDCRWAPGGDTGGHGGTGGLYWAELG